MCRRTGITKAMLLTSDKGMRPGSLTIETPRMLLPIAGIPVICYTMRWLSSHGIKQVAINLQHLSKEVPLFFGDVSGCGPDIVYSPEAVFLGSAGAVKRMDHFFESDFIVVHGNVLTDCDLTTIMRFHRERRSMATLALCKERNASAGRSIQVDKDGRVLNLVEKPNGAANPANLTSVGVYVLRPEVLDYVPDDRYCDFGHHVFLRLVRAGLPVHGYHLPPSAYIMDIGSPERYLRAHHDVASGRLKMDPAILPS